MKKTISLILCLVFMTLALAGCGKDGVGDDLDDSMKGYERVLLNLNFYIIGDETNDNLTVNARLSSYTNKNYNTNIQIFYLNENEYSEKVIKALDDAKTAIESGATDEASLNAIKNKPDIYLINSPEMMKSLEDKGHLADLTDFFYPENYVEKIFPKDADPKEVAEEKKKEKFHMELIKKTESLLNKISGSLVQASLMQREFDVILEGGTVIKETRDVNLCVPNNRVIGDYVYLLIHRDTAEEVYVGADTDLKEYTSYEAKNTLQLIEKIKTEKGITEEEVKEKYVQRVLGKYEDKAMYEANGFACNIISYPQVAGIDAAGVEVPDNVDNVFNSAFAINALSDVDRAMEIVFALNTDATLHNFLQYGVENTNYTNYSIGDSHYVNYAQIKDVKNKYFMNPMYTGNMFNLASYSFDPAFYAANADEELIITDALAWLATAEEGADLLEWLKTRTNYVDDPIALNKLESLAEIIKLVEKRPAIFTEISWTELDKANGKIQNEQSSVYKVNP